jgi:hypothetical protein
VCVTGFGLFKMLRLLEKDESFRPLPTNLRREPCALAGHAWMPDNDRLLLATRGGELLVAEGGDVKKVLDAPVQEHVRGSVREYLDILARTVCAAPGRRALRETPRGAQQ